MTWSDRRNVKNLPIKLTFKAPSRCDPYSLYVQLSRFSRLDGIVLLSKVRERDFVDNKVAGSMVAAEERLDLLCS